MRNHTLLLSLIACSEPSPAGLAGSGAPPPPSPAPSIAPAPEPPCLPFGRWHGVHLFAADDKRVVVCTADRLCQPKHPTCIAHDLASGARSTTSPPIAPVVAPAYRVEQSGEAFQLCGPERCSKLALRFRAMEVIDPMVHVALSPDGKIAALAGEKIDALYLVEAATGKRIARVTAGGKFSTCFAEPFFLGDSIYVRTCVGSFPKNTDFLFGSDGRRIGEVEYVDISIGDRPVHVIGTQWAVRAHHSDGYVVFDAATGERVRSVPETNLGDVELDEPRGPIRTPAGKLVMLGREIVVTNPLTGEHERSWPLPFCADEPAEPPACD